VNSKSYSKKVIKGLFKALKKDLNTVKNYDFVNNKIDIIYKLAISGFNKIIE